MDSFFEIAELRLKLTAPQLGAEAAVLQKGLVIPLLDDMAVLHDQDHIGLLDGGEAVGHDEGGAPLHEGGKCAVLFEKSIPQLLEKCKRWTKTSAPDVTTVEMICDVCSIFGKAC